MKINLLLYTSLFYSSLLTAQCPLEKQLIGHWVWANTAEVVAVFHFKEDKTVDLHAANDLLKEKTPVQWTLLPDCSLVMKNHLNPEDASTIEFTKEGLLAITTKSKKDEFGITFPSSKIFLKRLSNDNQALTQYLQGLKKSYPEIYHAMIHTGERRVLQVAYATQYEKETRKRDSLAVIEASAAAEKAVQAAAMEESKMTPVTPPDAKADTAEQPPVISFSEEMTQVALKAENGEPEWALSIQNGYANFFATDADKSPTVDISLPMSQYAAQTLDNVSVKLLQFHDPARNGSILTVTISENGKNHCSDGKSDAPFKYSVNVIFQGKKYTGCGQ